MCAWSSSVSSCFVLPRIATMRRPLAWPTLSLPALPSLPFQPTARLSFVWSQAFSSDAVMFTASAKSFRTLTRSSSGMAPERTPRSPAQHGRRTVSVAHDLDAALDHRCRSLEHGYVLQRIALDGHDVAEAADRNRSDIVATQCVGGVAGRGLDRLQRGHSVLDHRPELPSDLAVRHHARVASEHHADTGSMSLPEIVPLDLPDLSVLAQILLQHTVLLALRLRVVRVVDVHREPDGLLALQCEPDALVVHQAHMLDGIDTRADGSLDSFRTMGVRRDAQVPVMRLIGDRAQLLLR